MKQKIKIMKTGPQVTEQELSQFMDFDALLKRKEQILKAQRVRNVFVGIIALMIIPAIVITITRLFDANQTATAERNGMSSPSAVVSPDSLKSMTSAPDVVVPAPKPTVDSTRPSPKAVDRSTYEEKKQGDTPPVMKEEHITTPSGYIQPEPVDGYPALYAYFDKELKYPTVAAADSAEGIVTVSFVIDINGKIKKITMENSLGAAFDQEVRRLIDHMPSWRPATYDGNPVESKVSLPITFSLKRNTNP